MSEKDAEIDELLEKLLESRNQIDAMRDQLKDMEKNLKIIKVNILHVMNYLSGKLFLKQIKKNQNQAENIPRDMQEVMNLLIQLEFRVASLEKRVENLEKETHKIKRRLMKR